MANTMNDTARNAPQAMSPSEAPMHWFSTDAFLTTLAQVHFPGRQFRAGTYASHGRHFRLLAVEGRDVIAEWPFLDFVTPLEREAGTVDGFVNHVPHVALETVEIADKPSLAPGTEPAPFILWDRFADWAAFERHFVARRSSLLRDSKAKRRRLEKDLGPLRFSWEDPRPEVFSACVAWKSAQYVRTGLLDVLEPTANVALFRALHAKGALAVSSLSAGSTLLAVHFGALSARGVYSWIAAYDPSFGRHSPGRLLLEDMLRESQARGHMEWDFGIGDMDYKWHYSTHSRIVGPLGRPPFMRAMGKLASTGLKRALCNSPALLDRARRFRRRIQTRLSPFLVLAERFRGKHDRFSGPLRFARKALSHGERAPLPPDPPPKALRDERDARQKGAGCA